MLKRILCYFGVCIRPTHYFSGQVWCAGAGSCWAKRWSFLPSAQQAWCWLRARWLERHGSRCHGWRWALVGWRGERKLMCGTISLPQIQNVRRLFLCATKRLKDTKTHEITKSRKNLNSNTKHNFPSFLTGKNKNGILWQFLRFDLYVIHKSVQVLLVWHSFSMGKK